MQLTYLQFHALFVLPVLFVLAVAATRARSPPSVPARPNWWLGVAAVELIALVYTIPWDNLLIAADVWWYGPGRVVATVWHAPVEEYLFIALQPLAVALWLYRLRPPVESVDVTRLHRLAGVLAGGAVGVVGAVMFLRPATLYLGAILAWSGPVLALQWGVGWPYLLAKGRSLLVGVAVPTVYLCVADRIALASGIWSLSERYTTGLTVLGLPVEEAAFFLLTTTFVVQGLLLYDWVLETDTASQRWVSGRWN